MCLNSHMPPQQTYMPYGQTPAPVPGPEQYDFILNGNHKPASRFTTPRSMTGRILVVAGGGAVLLIAALVLVSILSKPTATNVTALESIAQRQTELARISQTPILAASSQTTQNFAATTMLSLLSEQQAFVSFLQQRGVKVSSSVLQATKDSSTDTTLKNAQTSGDYDQQYVAVADSQLNSYEQALRQEFTASKDASERQLISNAYMYAKLLSQQSTQQ